MSSFLEVCTGTLCAVQVTAVAAQLSPVCDIGWTQPTPAFRRAPSPSSLDSFPQAAEPRDCCPGLWNCHHAKGHQSIPAPRMAFHAPSKAAFTNSTRQDFPTCSHFSSTSCAGHAHDRRVKLAHPEGPFQSQPFHGVSLFSTGTTELIFPRQDPRDPSSGRGHPPAELEIIKLERFRSRAAGTAEELGR